MVAEARFSLRAVDETRQAFASVQNNLARLQQQSRVAGQALTKNLDVKDAMRSVAVAVGLSVDKIAEKIGRLVTGTSAEQEKEQEKALALQERLGALQRKNAQDRLGQEQLLVQLKREEASLLGKVTSDKSAFGTEGFTRMLEDSVRLEEVRAQIATIIAKKQQDQAQYAEQYGRALNETREAEQELDEVLGRKVDKEKLLNNLWKQRALFIAQIQELEKDRANNTGALAVAQRNLAEVTRSIIPLERERSQLARQSGEILSRGFEDAVLSGEKLRDVLKGVAQDLIRILFQQQITQPLAAGIGNFLAGFRAEGGPVSAGSPYIVGEKGPELFVPRSSGSIVPNSRLAGSSGSSGGMSGGSVNVTYNIAAGVTKAELIPILESQSKRLKAEIPDMVRRGGAYRSAFA